jgi:hypothetical protein
MTGLTGVSFGGGPGQPGFVDPFSLGVLGQQTGIAEQAMHNRYSQLGLGVPSGSPQDAAKGGTNLQSTGPGTAEQMDLGQLPSQVGGIPAMAEATLGQMQTNALNQPSGVNKLGGLGGLGALGGI